jgi:adenine-specific DNA-methyltransferase
MTWWEQLESARLILQAGLDGRKTALERNRMGQFATPTLLARQVVAYGVNLLDPVTKVRFFDPAIGTGSFYSALCTTTDASRIESATGFEVDPHYGEPAKTFWRDGSLTIRMGDFTKAVPDNEKCANLIICNPPYIRHHHIAADTKNGLQSRTEQACGIQLSGLSGLYCYFIGLAHRWMEDGAIAGWLIPSEFMDVNYGMKIKEYLLTKVQLLHIHRFDPADVQFSDALVSSAIVWFRNTKPKAGHSAHFSFGGTLNAPTLSRDVPLSQLQGEAKWSRYPASEMASTKANVTLGDLFTIKRGIATGNNKFFIMTREEIEQRGLPMECFTPVLPGPRYIMNNEVHAGADGIPFIEKPLFLLDTKLSGDEIHERYPSLWEYLETGKQGDAPVADRYLCKTRNTWYTQENRPAAPIICTYMGRSHKGAKPFRFILNHSRATACNVYLLLYPKPDLVSAIKCDPALLKRTWTYLNEITTEELLGNSRVYGGGLYKLEPRELKNVSAMNLVRDLPECRYEKSTLPAN